MKIYLQAWIPKAGNHTTDECRRSSFAEVRSAEEASGQIETDMDSSFFSMWIVPLTYNLSNERFFKHLEENSSYLQLSYLGTPICVLFYEIRWSAMFFQL